MEERELKEISLTDPDARLMKTRHGMDVCYNAQVSVDGKNHLIAEYDLRNDQNDKGSLLPTSRITGDFLHSTDMEVVADKGYFSFDNVRDMWLDGFDAYIPEEKFGNKRKRGKEPFSPFDQSNFVYDSSNDTQTSPAGATLHRSRENIRTHNNMNWIYSIGTLTCCHLHSKAASGYRRIVRWEYQEDLDKHRRKMSILGSEKMKKRRALAEHPFEAMKRALSAGYTLLRGERKVFGEFSPIALEYNMRRVIDIKGVSALIQAL